MHDCPVCRQVRGLETTVDMTGAAIGEAWKPVQADPDNGERRAEFKTAIERYLSAVEAIKQFAKTNYDTLSKHGTRVKHLP